MKTRMVQLAAGFALIVLISSLSQAQMPIKQLMMRVHIPFAFIAGGAHLRRVTISSITQATRTSW